MINFLSIFRSQIPDIIKRLSGIRTELDQTQSNIEHLLSIERELSEASVNEDDIMQSSLVEIAVNNFAVAMWLKDLNGRFLYVNKVCCDTILGCSVEEALNLTDSDLRKDALAVVCMKTDIEVIKHKTTKRWIEFALYEDGRKVFIDTIKSPIFNENGDIIGTIGNAVNITDKIPEIIKCQDRKSNSIEIPLNTTLSLGEYAHILERRLQPREEGEDNAKA